MFFLDLFWTNADKGSALYLKWESLSLHCQFTIFPKRLAQKGGQQLEGDVPLGNTVQNKRLAMERV